MKKLTSECLGPCPGECISMDEMARAWELYKILFNEAFIVGPSLTELDEVMIFPKRIGNKMLAWLEKYPPINL